MQVAALAVKGCDCCKVLIPFIIGLVQPFTAAFIACLSNVCQHRLLLQQAQTYHLELNIYALQCHATYHPSCQSMAQQLAFCALHADTQKQA